jgi:hypothetical protein
VEGIRGGSLELSQATSVLADEAVGSKSVRQIVGVEALELLRADEAHGLGSGWELGIIDVFRAGLLGGGRHFEGSSAAL